MHKLRVLCRIETIFTCCLFWSTGCSYEIYHSSAGTRVGDEALRYVSTIPILSYLDLSYSRVSDAGICHLKFLRCLNVVSLLHCPGIYSLSIRGMLPSSVTVKLTWLHIFVLVIEVMQYVCIGTHICLLYVCKCSGTTVMMMPTHSLMIRTC